MTVYLMHVRTRPQEDQRTRGLAMASTEGIVEGVRGEANKTSRPRWWGKRYKALREVQKEQRQWVMLS